MVVSNRASASRHPIRNMRDANKRSLCSIETRSKAEALPGGAGSLRSQAFCHRPKTRLAACCMGKPRMRWGGLRVNAEDKASCHVLFGMLAVLSPGWRMSHRTSHTIGTFCP